VKTCPRCGFHHIDQDERCVRCGAYLDPIGPPDPLAPPGREVFEFRPGRLSRWRWEAPHRWLGRLRRWRHVWRERLRSPLPEGVHERNPWVAGWLSLIPGLGQLYNHQPKKAALFFSFILFITAAAALTWYRTISNTILLGTLLAMMVAFHDGLLTAKRINRDYLPWQHAVGFYCAWILYVCLFCLAAQFVGRHFLVKLRYIPYEDMAPAFRRGERIGVDCFSFILRKPRVGDVVLYDPPAIVMEQPENSMAPNGVIVIDPTSAIERVVGGPGQKFERRGGQFFLDGQSVPPERQPLVQDQIPWNFAILAPPDAYIILFSYAGSSFNPVSFFQDAVAPAPKRAGEMFTEHAPRLNAPGWIVRAWERACLVKKEDIMGRVWFVYNPPPQRRFVR